MDIPPFYPRPLPSLHSWRWEKWTKTLAQGDNAFLLGSVTSSHVSKGRVPLTLNQSVPRPANGGAYAPREKIEAAEAEKRGERPGSGLGWVPVGRPPAEGCVGARKGGSAVGTAEFYPFSSLRFVFAFEFSFVLVFLLRVLILLYLIVFCVLRVLCLWCSILSGETEDLMSGRE